MTWARGNSSAMSIALLQAEYLVVDKRKGGQTTSQRLYRDLELERHEHLIEKAKGKAVTSTMFTELQGFFDWTDIVPPSVDGMH